MLSGMLKEAVVSDHTRPRSHPQPRALRVAMGLTVLLAGLSMAVTGIAKEPRPTEMPYENVEGIPSLDPSYRQSSHKVVLITDQALSPRLATLEEGQLVAWISYSKIPSTIIFEREVARSMICHSLVNFSLVDDELRSAEIRPGEFASFCQLKPGRYRYKVVRTDPTGGSAASASRRLEGEIIVGNP